MKISRTLIKIGILLACAGCGVATNGIPAGSAPADAELSTVRHGTAGGCAFSARGALTDQYTCTGFAVNAGVSTVNTAATIGFSPSASTTTTASGTLQFNSNAIAVGSYTLKDMKSAVFSVTQKTSNVPNWLCQEGTGTSQLGALKLQITSSVATATLGTSTSYLVHGVFEALLVPVDGHSTGKVILHGEF